MRDPASALNVMVNPYRLARGTIFVKHHVPPVCANLNKAVPPNYGGLSHCNVWFAKLFNIPLQKSSRVRCAMLSSLDYMQRAGILDNHSSIRFIGHFATERDNSSIFPIIDNSILMSDIYKVPIWGH